MIFVEHWSGNRLGTFQRSTSCPFPKNGAVPAFTTGHFGLRSRMALNWFRLPSLNARSIFYLALALLIFTFPLPVHWVLFHRGIAGIYRELTDLVFYPSDGAMLLLIVSGARSTDWRAAWLGRPRSLLLPLLLLAFYSAASSVWAFDILLALQTALRLFLLFASVAVIVRLRPNPRFVQCSVLVTGLFQAAVAILQYRLQGDLGLHWLGELTLNRYPGGGSIIQVGEQYWLRAYGLTPHPNILGGVAVVCTLLLLAPTLRSKWPYQPAWMAASLAAATSLFLSFSRAAWLGGLVAVSMLTAVFVRHRTYRRTYRRTLTIVAVAGACLLLFLTWTQWPLLKARSSPNSSQYELRSVNERAVLNEAAWEIIRLSPLTGVGAGNSTPTLIPFLSDTPEVGAQPIHNVPLLLMAELGVAGAALWLWLMVAPIYLAWQRLRQGRLTVWALLLAAALVAFAVIDLFDYYAWGWNQGRVLRWLLWGLFGAEISKSTYEGAEDEMKHMNLDHTAVS